MSTRNGHKKNKKEELLDIHSNGMSSHNGDKRLSVIRQIIIDDKEEKSSANEKKTKPFLLPRLLD